MWLDFSSLATALIDFSFSAKLSLILFHSSYCKKKQSEGCVVTMPNIHSVLANFEKTITANEKAGVSSKMFLSNVAKRPTSTIAMKPAGAGMSMSGSRSHHSRGRLPAGSGHSRHLNNHLPQVPETKNMSIPSDVTISTAATSTASTIEDFDDPFASDEVSVLEDDLAFPDDYSHNPADNFNKLHGSLASVESSNN